jgi:hypothetical protein
MYSKSQRLRQAVLLFPKHTYSDRKSVKHLRRAWLHKIDLLGDKWVLHEANSPVKNSVPNSLGRV